MTDGGVNAIAGFRYQMLRAMEEILELHRDSPGGDWAVEVEHAANDKVDYAVYRSGTLTRVVQVKASLPHRSTKLVLHAQNGDGVAGILTQLAAAFPSAPEVALISNREGPWEKIRTWVSQNQSNGGPRLRAERDQRSVYAVEKTVRETLRDIRLHNRLPSDPETVFALAGILEQRLWRLGSQDRRENSGSRRLLEGPEANLVLGLKDQELATATGELSWAMRWKEPAGRAIVRPAAMSFLASELSVQEMANGRVRRAVLCGFGGLGKSTIAAVWAGENQGLYSLVIWLTGASSDAIEADARQLLSSQYGEDVTQWPTAEVQRKLLEWLHTTPRSWLLVIDDAANVDIIDSWLPNHGYGHVVITTRNSTWPASRGLSFEIARLTDHEIVDLVGIRHPSLHPSPSELTLLAALSDGWALAVDMILAWLTRTGHSLADLAGFDCAKSRQLLLEEPDLRPAGYPEPVIVLILDALASVQSEDPDAWSLLQSASALGGDGIPVALASSSSDISLSPEAMVARDKLVWRLRSRSLVSAFSVADPRLGIWGHRINVHALVTQTITQLDPISLAQWENLLESVISLVCDATEAGRFTLVLSLTAICDAIDQRIHEGAPFTIGYLTLLGNSAVSLAMNGRLQEAAARLEHEQRIATAQTRVLDPHAAEPVEWFGLVATAQLASIRFRMEQFDEALGLLEQVVPQIDHFKTKVLSEKLSNLMEVAIDTLSAIRDPEFAQRRDNLLAVASSMSVQPSHSACRRAEQFLRDGNLVAARAVCDRALAGSPTAAQKIELFGLLAESWSVKDVAKSNQLLEMAQIIATEHDIDSHLALSHTHDVIHQRIIHLATLEPHALCPRLDRYSSWFELAHLMLPNEYRNDHERIMTLVQQAWLQITQRSPAAGRTISTLVATMETPSKTISPEQQADLRLLTWATQYAHACNQLGQLEPCGPIGRAGSTIYIESSQLLWDALPNLFSRALIHGEPLTVAQRFGPYVLINIVGWGLTGNCLDQDLFASVDWEVTVNLVPPASSAPHPRADHRGPITVKITGPIVPLGTVTGLRPSSTYVEWHAIASEAVAADSRHFERPHVNWRY